MAIEENKAPRDESYPAMPEWTPNQAKLHEAICEAMKLSIPDHEAAPVFEYWAKLSKHGAAQADKQGR